MVDKEDFEAFLKTRQGQIAQVCLVRLPSWGSISCCACTKMCSGTYMSEHKNRKPSKPSKWWQAYVTLAGRGMTDCTLWKPASAKWLHWMLGWHVWAQVAPNCPRVSVAKQSHPHQTHTAPLKHAAWFEDLTPCTRILPHRNTWTFSLPCLSFMVEMQSVTFWALM